MKNCFTAFAGVLISLIMNVSMAVAAEKMQLPADSTVKQTPPPAMKMGPQVVSPQKSASSAIVDIDKTPAQPQKGQILSKPIPGSVPLFRGRVTDIKGNVITLKDAKGQERVIEVDSASALTTGADAWCEEDCRKQIRTASTAVNVRRVLVGMSKSDLVEKASGMTKGGGAKIRKKSRSEISGSEEEDLEGLEVQR